SAGNTDELAAFGRQLAMHVASASPQALEAGSLEPSVVAREREVLAEKAKAQGKPADVVNKIVESGLKAFYKEACLVDQVFISPESDGKKTVAQAVTDAEGKAGPPVKLTRHL